jgi:lipid II:glycine glycyltransferase (peptidoglycan interpeptide bridge formation enzyme)
VASILLVQHKTTLVYKYGCSDATYNRYGATSALFWRAISDGKLAGCIDFDLGRSDMDDCGLIAFKEHLGARRKDLNYYRYRKNALGRVDTRWQGAFRRAFATMPQAVQTVVGSGLYRHFA